MLLKANLSEATTHLLIPILLTTMKWISTIQQDSILLKTQKLSHVPEEPVVYNDGWLCHDKLWQQFYDDADVSLLQVDSIACHVLDPSFLDLTIESAESCKNQFTQLTSGNWQFPSGSQIIGYTSYASRNRYRQCHRQWLKLSWTTIMGIFFK